MPKTINFRYLNHRGVEEDRTVDVDSVEFHFNPGLGYQPGWFISGFCHKKLARRSFALTRIIFPEEANPGVNNTVKIINLKDL